MIIQRQRRRRVDASNTALELHADNRSQITFYGFQFPTSYPASIPILAS
jgi:hypothetical protein